MANQTLPDDPFPEKANFTKSLDWFARRLEGKSREDCILIAARAALRLLPALAAVLPHGNPKTKARENARTVLPPLLRCHLFSLVASLAPVPERERFRAASSAIANAGDPNAAAARAAHTVEASVRDIAAVSDAAICATDAVGAVNGSYSSGEYGSGVALASINAAIHTNSATAAATATAIWADLEVLGGKAKARRSLALAPLWPDGPPAQMQAQWDGFSSKLRSHGDDWEIWADWYGGGTWNGKRFPGLLQGSPARGPSLFGLSRPKALKVLHDVALIDDAFWKSGPAKLNAEFKRIVEEARGEGQIVQPTSIESADQFGTPTVTVTPPRNRRAARTPNPKTAIGKAVIENARVLVLQTDITARLIRAEIERLRATPANHPETQEDQAKQIDALEAWLKSAEQTKEAVEAYEKGQKPEGHLVRTVKEFARSCKAWWDSRGSKHAENVVTTGLIAGGTHVLTLTKADPSLCLAIAGVVIGGKTVADGIAALKGGGKKP